MRMILAVLLLSSFVFAHDFVKVTLRRPGGTVVAVAPLTTPDGNFPMCVVRTSKNRHRLIGYGLDGVQFYSAALSATPLGMRNIGGTLSLAQMSGRTVSLLSILMVRGAVAPVVYGSEEMTGLRRATYHGIVRRGGTPLLVFSQHRDVVSMVTPGKYRHTLRFGRSHTFLGCTDVFDADADRLDDMILFNKDGRIVRLEQRNRAGPLEGQQDYPFRSEGVAVAAIAAAGNQLWLGGSRKGRAVLLLFDPNAAPSIHKIKDIFKTRSTGGRDPKSQYTLGRGSVTGLEIMGKNHMVVAGMREGRAWIGVVTRTGRLTVTDEATLSGTRITSFCVNPMRRGWTVAAATDDGALHVLRSPGDPDARRRRPTPVPGGKPVPVPGPGTDTGTGGKTHTHTSAYFPRIEADTRRGLDTTLHLLYLGARPVSLTVRFYTTTGSLVAQHRVTVRRNTRTKLSLSEVLRKHHVFDLDGWAVVTGCDKTDLVVEGLVYRGSATPESLRPFWR